MSTRKDTEWLINKSKSLFGDILDYSESIYIDAKTKIQFRCKKHNYLFIQTSNNHFKSKQPCNLCLNESRRESFSDGLDVFKNKINDLYGEKFDFDKAIYINQRTPITLICKKHNKLIIKEPQVFLRGHGCDQCNKEEIHNKLSIITLNEINVFVKKLNGKCHSNEYINNESKLKFECEAGHIFENSWSGVKNLLRWCPKCNSNKLIGESLTRLILEHLLQIKLPSMYIKEMEGLQLDGYCEKHKIAFEYQGYQHFTRRSHFHKDEKRYDEQLKRDLYKKELCVKNGITLIEIIEFKSISSGRIELFVNQVKERLDELKLNYNQNPFDLDFIELYRGRKSGLYERAKRIVEEQKGKLQQFIGSESKHTFICREGHEIKNRTLGVIINTNASCSFCDSEEKFKKLKEIIESRGGEFLEKKLKSKGLTEKYKWVCDKGHFLESKGQYLYNGFWCKICQNENKKVNLRSEDVFQFKIDVSSGKYYQNELPSKYGIGATTYRRIIKDLKLEPKYLPQDRKAQKKRTKGKLFQIDPKTFNIIKVFDSLEDVKNDESGLFKPEGIGQQMKKYKKAYGYYWSRENDYNETIMIIKLNNSDCK